MNKLGRNSLALGAATLLVTAAVQFSATGAPGDIAQSNASAITASGLTGIVDSDVCLAESTDGTPVATGSGTCGTGLSAAGIAGTFNQNASTGLSGLAGTSQADASVAGLDALSLKSIDISTLGTDLSTIDTGTVLDGPLQGLGLLLDTVLNTLGLGSLDALLGQVQSAVISNVTGALSGVVDVTLELPAVEARCTATAGGTPTMETTITGDTHLKASLGGNEIVDAVLPVNDLSPNAALVGSVAPQEIVNAILDDVRATLLSDTTLMGTLGALDDVIAGIQDQVINAVLDALGPALLDPLGDALGPILNGTVNKQVTNPDGSVEVTALEVNVLGSGAHLALARAACGPNAFAAADDADAVADADADAVADADANADADAVADADANADADAIADADTNADADATAALPDTGAPNLLPFFLLGFALVAFGLAVLVNERRRLGNVA